VPLFDYQVEGPTGQTKIDRVTDIPNGGDPKSLDVSFTGVQPSSVVGLVRRNRFGVQRGSKELRLGMRGRVTGNTAAGIVIDLGSALSDRKKTTDIRNRKGYVIELDPTSDDRILFRKGMLESSETVFVGKGLVTDLSKPRVGPLNWNHLLVQLEFDDDDVARIRIRGSSDDVDAVTPTWFRIEDMPDIELGKFDTRPPGWIGLYGRGTNGSLARFNTVSLTDKLTVL